MGADAVLCFAFRIFKCGSKMCPYGENSTEFVLISKTKRRLQQIVRWLATERDGAGLISHVAVQSTHT